MPISYAPDMTNLIWDNGCMSEVGIRRSAAGPVAASHADDHANRKINRCLTSKITVNQD